MDFDTQDLRFLGQIGSSLHDNAGRRTDNAQIVRTGHSLRHLDGPDNLVESQAFTENVTKIKRKPSRQ